MAKPTAEQIRTRLTAIIDGSDNSFMKRLMPELLRRRELQDGLSLADVRMHLAPSADQIDPRKLAKALDVLKAEWGSLTPAQQTAATTRLKSLESDVLADPRVRELATVYLEMDDTLGLTDDEAWDRLNAELAKTEGHDGPKLHRLIERWMST